MLSRRTAPLSRLAARLSPRRAALSTAADEYTPEYTTSPGPLWPVFETAYGKLAINICCTPRHRPATRRRPARHRV